MCPSSWGVKDGKSLIFNLTSIYPVPTGTQRSHGSRYFPRRTLSKRVYLNITFSKKKLLSSEGFVFQTWFRPHLNHYNSISSTRSSRHASWRTSASTSARSTSSTPSLSSGKDWLFRIETIHHYFNRNHPPSDRAPKGCAIRWWIERRGLYH